MNWLPKKRLAKRITFNTLKCGLIGFAIFFGILPFFFKYSTVIQKGFVFLNFIQYPMNTDFNAPEKSGINGARNLYIKYHSNIASHRVRIGVWHILPEKYKNWTSVDIDNSALDKDSRKDAVFDDLLAKGDCPVILYVHGNANHRGSGHRLELYKVLQDLQYHIIAFDYRGYGDSSRSEVTEIGIVEDMINVYRWVLEKVQSQNTSERGAVPVYVWGHSLGTGISTHALSVLAADIATSDNQNDIYQLREPNGLILESPFNNMFDEFEDHFIGKIYSWLPWFDWMILKAIDKSNITFKSDEYITSFASPVLILHAKDDFIVPYHLGFKLYNSAIQYRSSEYGEVQFKGFESSDKLGHKYICRAQELPTLINTFVTKYYRIFPQKINRGRAYLPWIEGERQKILHEKQV
ncbi:lysophosphatidylserine lipase ABHD12 isoform X2 [Arctopsyche grandis]|uniref:lysophosphatidylserine lipase ABHD12 isoform X2 n=1 Tax=Arctopsyche grandis TaxID=121162 RepID=UPI00406D9615